MKTVIITEKPKVSLRIAQSIAPEYVRRGEKGVPYYEVKHNGDRIFIASAVGHLYSLAQREGDWRYPVFNVKWELIYKLDRSKAYLRKYVQLLKKLAEDADAFCIATDFDLEGELLGYNALRFACTPGSREVFRMRFSTLTQRDLARAFENPARVDLKLVDAAEARHIMDWFWGINTSRALSLAGRRIKRGFTTISAGRVQTPALAMLVDREKEILDFKPVPYWEVFADLDAKGEKVKATHVDGKVFDKEEAKRILENSKADEAVVERVKKKDVKTLAPFPFDLGSLQTEAYRLFGFVPKGTQQIAQSLYEGGYISYPRTSSQKLPAAIGYKRILLNLRENPAFKAYAGIILKKERLRPRQGPKTDPAHPAIYPTGIMPKKLNPREEKLYKLVVHRFMATFGNALIRETVNVNCKIGREKFVFDGSRTVEEGWTRLYPYVRFKEVVLPDLFRGDLLKVLRVYSAKKETKPPPRFNPASLVKELESRGLGTKATRAEIVATLYDRGYIRGRNIKVTELGASVISALEEHVPAIISEELTRRFEEKLENIREGKESKEFVLEEAKNELTKILEEFKKKERLVGEKLVKALEEKERREGIVGDCPNCGSPLKVVRSRKTGKIFIGCSTYPKCSTSYPLPQKVGIKTTKKKCNLCGLPMVSIPLGKRRVLSCIDMNCKSKEKYLSKK